MAQDLSIEHPNLTVFITIRSMASRLWFLRNKSLYEHILGFLAKYQEKYGVIIYGFIIMGNHYHLLAKFPNRNRVAFLRSFNSIIARILPKYAPKFKEGRLWGRRARAQVVPNNADILHTFLYLVLNPVSSGVCRWLNRFKGYNCRADHYKSHGRKFTLINWDKYRNFSRSNSKLRPQDCAEEYTLKFSRLPGYEHLSEADYMKTLESFIEERRVDIIKKRLSEGQGFAEDAVEKIKSGDIPRNTKKSTRYSKRPLVLTLCADTREKFLAYYFAVLEAYKLASEKFRAGDYSQEFPPGTYKPPLSIPS